MSTATAITMHPVTSSQISAIGHCATTETLAIQFTGKAGPGSLYHYANFTAAEYAAFAGAESVGKHFYAHIKPHADKHPYKKIEAAAPAPAAPAALAKDVLAALLSGREMGAEITKEEEAQAKTAGLLVIFGASDDLMEFRGAANDELGCYDGGTALIDAKGVLPDRESIEDDDALRDFFAREPLTKKVEALFAAEGDYTWTYRTDVPHATFEIVEGDEKYCRGIVIDLADLAPAP